jgi:hypothetical protein
MSIMLSLLFKGVRPTSPRAEKRIDLLFTEGSPLRGEPGAEEFAELGAESSDLPSNGGPPSEWQFADNLLIRPLSNQGKEESTNRGL